MCVCVCVCVSVCVFVCERRRQFAKPDWPVSLVDLHLQNDIFKTKNESLQIKGKWCDFLKLYWLGLNIIIFSFFIVMPFSLPYFLSINFGQEK